MEIDVQTDCSTTGNGSHKSPSKVPIPGIASAASSSAVPVYVTEADICQRITYAEAQLHERKRMTEASKILATQANLLYDAGHMKKDMFMEIHRQWQDSERQLKETERQYSLRGSSDIAL
ncbi:hypothetical protein CDAR_261201 [Caerostris darwini]|uniref:No apical meristem-associated C-terminal domain-containing protein n=1 Tax=Caerostris darwini TaxID=1538125 RepID=A0AAV4WEJ6_9ARAC|nr:hypothetical protein CDAR_261201 [Caerostris darwini]